MKRTLCLLLLASSAIVQAADPTPASAPAASTAAPKAQSTPLAPVHIDQPIVGRHRGQFGGHTLSYRSVIEPFIVTNPKNEPVAKLVATSYIADVRQTRDRPIVFVFNGGPIAATTPLHLGLFGPKRLAIPDDISADPSTFKLVDNPYAPLDAVDIVIFDPANTGFSRTLPGISPSTQFSNVADGRQLAQLVLAWVKAHGRTRSPVYLLGESYGTMRAVEAADQLSAAGSPVAGIMLLGQAVNIIEYAQRPNNIISYAVSLPTLAAIGWWHDLAERKGRTFDQFIKDAQDYGAGEYLSVLFQGDKAPADLQARVARRLQEFTGLPAAEFLKQRLKLSKTSYQRLLFPGRMLDANDARYFVPEGRRSASYASRYEPEAVQYYADFLKVPASAGEYSLANPAEAAFTSWVWADNKTPFLDWPYVGQLKSTMDGNPRMRLFVGNGYYDTQTTIGAMDYLVAQSGFPADRVETRYYQGGHMFYTVEQSAKSLGEDVRRFVTPSAAPHAPEAGKAQ